MHYGLQGHQKKKKGHTYGHTNGVTMSLLELLIAAKNHSEHMGIFSLCKMLLFKDELKMTDFVFR